MAGDKDILAQTVYHEARGEGAQGWRAVAFVIMTRARANRSRWGGSSVSDVCKQQFQFECWNAGRNTEINDTTTYNAIKKVTDRIYEGSDRDDPTGGADHYNNPRKEGYPPWTGGCTPTVKIGNHQFYKEN